MCLKGVFNKTSQTGKDYCRNDEKNFKKYYLNISAPMQLIVIVKICGQHLQ